MSTDGILTIPMAEYHAIDRASPHRLLDMERSAAYCKARMDSKEDESTPDRLRGEAMHCLLLEPDAFAARFVLKDYDGRTKDGKARKAQIEATGLQPLDVDTWDAAHRSADAVRLHPVAKRILDACVHHERSFLATLDGIPTKGRPDAYGDGILVDLKSIRTAMETAFPRFVAETRVDRQLAIYANQGAALGAFSEQPECFVIAVMPDPPHEVRVYDFDDATLCDAWDSAQGLLRAYHACATTNAWGAGGENVIPFVRAPWDRLGKPVAIEDMIL